MVQHLFKQVKSDIHIRVRGKATANLLEACRKLSRTRLDTLYERADSKIVGFESTTAHQAEESPCLAHLVAADKNVDERVEGHIGRPKAHFTHSVKQLLRTLNHSLLSTALEKCVERYLVHMEEVAAGVSQHKLDYLNGFLNLATLDAAVKQDV